MSIFNSVVSVIAIPLTGIPIINALTDQRCPLGH
jgi:hypothetical protein